MPPAARHNKAAKETPKKRSTLYEGCDEEFFVAVVEAFHQVHQSVAQHPSAKKLVMERVKSDPDEVKVALRQVSVGVLKQAAGLSPEAQRRHYGFLRDVFKSIKETQKTDEAAVHLLQALLPYAMATSKHVRLHVVSMFDELLRTLDPSVTTDDRQQFYDNVTQVLKQRVYDVCPQVRERAVAAISSFQGGAKDDDVTCHLVSILLEDQNADVRRQVLKGTQSGNGSKEFLHVYFAAMLRSTRDVVAKVREAAWESLHRFKWTHVNHYCKRELLDSLHHVALGLSDPSVTVRTACRLTVMKSWLQRDMKDDATAFLDAIGVDFRAMEVDLASAEKVAKELLEYYRKTHPSSNDDSKFELRYIKPEGEGAEHKGLSFGNVLMWKARCEELAKRQSDGGDSAEVENHLLIPLPVYHEVLQDVIMLFAKPDEYTSKRIVLSGSETEEILRLLLSMLEIYSETGCLAHTDNTTRSAILKQLAFLLKVVPDNDPALFVDTAVKSIRLLTTRHPEEATSAVSDALNLLFSGVQVRKEHRLTLEDAETLGRLDAERRARLADMRRRYGPDDDDVAQLSNQITFDQKFLLRMQHIIMSFLSHAMRLERVPPFCSYVVQLGRQQCDFEVKVVATRSLALLCLIHPEAVHTFFPVLMSDALAGDSMYSPQSLPPAHDVPTAALATLFDIVCEYSLKFFDASAAPPPKPRADDNSVSDESILQQHDVQREAAELAAIAEGGIHKRGSVRVLRQLLQFLGSKSFAQRQVAIAGFCKMLACNRVPMELVATIVAQLMANVVVEPTTKKGSTVVPQQVASLVQTFFTSYCSSSGVRQGYVAEGGMHALRVLLQKLPFAAALHQRVLSLVVRLTDAAVLKQVRDTDPEFAQQIAQEYNDEINAIDDDGAVDGTQHQTTRTSTAVLSRSIGHVRLRHELSRLSLHEYLAMELLTEVVAKPRCAVTLRLVAAHLGRLRFYCTHPVVKQRLLEHCKAAVEAVATDDAASKAVLTACLKAFKEELSEALNSAQQRDGAALAAECEMPRRLSTLDERLQARAQLMSAFEEVAASHDVAIDEDQDVENAALLVASMASPQTYLGFSPQAHSHQAASAASSASKLQPAPRQAVSSAAGASAKTAVSGRQQQHRRERAEDEIDLDDIVGRKKPRR